MPTQSQISYVSKRLQAIKGAKSSAIHKEYTSAPVFLSVDDKIKALQAGEFTVVNNSNTYWYSRIMFNAEKPCTMSAAGVAKLNKLNEEYTKAMDALYLGSDGDLLNAVKSLESFEV